MLYGRPFIYVNDLFLDPEAQTLQSYTMATGQSQQDISLWGVNQDPKDSKEPPLYAPGTQVLIKVWKDGSPKAQLQPTWKGPYPVILSTPTAVKVPGQERNTLKPRGPTCPMAGHLPAAGLWFHHRVDFSGCLNSLSPTHAVTELLDFE